MIKTRILTIISNILLLCVDEDKMSHKDYIDLMGTISRKIKD